MAISAPGADNSTPGGDFFSEAGNVYVFYGPVLRDMDMSEADATIRGIAEEERAGETLAGLGDTDGDGQADLGIGAPGAADGAGRVYIMTGPLSGSTPLALASARIDGGTAWARMGEALESGGDADADGHQDVLIGTPRLSAYTGQVSLFYGPISGTVSDLDADLTITGAATGHRLGTALAGGQDLDADGTPDILIGVPGEDTTADTAGAALLFFGSGS
jgi:hypothetical protein